MTSPTTPPPTTALTEALEAADPSARLQAALAAGTRPDPEHVPVLLARCAVEPDFYVRDMLTWALTRHPADLTVPRLVDELRRPTRRARSQALHTLSKIGDPRGWPAISAELLADPDDEVARSAWRAAVALVPDGAEPALAATLATQLGRGHRDVRLSLSRALAALGTAADNALAEAASHGDAEVRTHAVVTQRLVEDPDEGFDAAVFEAERLVALAAAPPAASLPAAPPAAASAAVTDAATEPPHAHR
ncbi:HEAT repeat domain-containing protein [Georgenia faecalis]|uniref:HEAT repeat domain-containing protein n=1 Tax=Georgenia faecalis TaxID=2483799 RepID=UPI000FD8A82C|nr:HEAT repeat domain-containing protein [Georgenia faecalis]